MQEEISGEGNIFFFLSESEGVFVPEAFGTREGIGKRKSSASGWNVGRTSLGMSGIGREREKEKMSKRVSENVIAGMR